MTDYQESINSLSPADALALQTQISPADYASNQPEWLTRFESKEIECPTCHGTNQITVENKRGITSASVNQVFEIVSCFDCRDGRVEIERCRYCGEEPYTPGLVSDAMCECDPYAPLPKPLA